MPYRDTDFVAGNVYDKENTRNPIARHLLSGYQRALEELLPRQAPRSILEVGSGEGRITAQLRERYPESRLAALDLSHAMAVQTSARVERVDTFCASAEELPLTSRAFDLVVCVEVLEHLPRPERALQHIARVARDVVVLSVPREPIWRLLNLMRGGYVRRLGDTPGHLQHWSSQAFTGLVGGYFDVKRVRHPLPWTMLQARISPS